ncbi:SigE family RNA polymerase sigma factor [Streptomyces sp. NPDC097619]|uniref:RNA polymerase sigma factor n=1 Tax=Streptomyces sp. NPDC097619 TaxID=3157228 RepID=UPI0033183247
MPAARTAPGSPGIPATPAARVAAAGPWASPVPDPYRLRTGGHDTAKGTAPDPTESTGSTGTPGAPPDPHGSPPAPGRPTVTDLYAAHRLPMVRLAVLLVDDLATAEDVVQDAFTALYRRHGERITEVDNALGYLRTAVVNTARSVLRRRRTARAWIPPVEPPAASAEETVVLGEEHREVLAALRGLSPRRRQVLVLRYWSGLSEAQIADTLGISRGAVKSHASRGLAALERMLAGDPA